MIMGAVVAAVLAATLVSAPVEPVGPGFAAGPFDSAVDRRGRVYVTEGDALIRLMPRGRRTTVAEFPSRVVPAPGRLPDGTPRGGPVRMPPVPSAVAMGPDGAFYVGELTGFPFPPGRARVWRVVPGRPPEVYAGGFTAVVDLDWGPGGLYVLELARHGLLSGDRTGALLRVEGSGRRATIASDGLAAPSGLTIRNGVAYVTTCADCPGEGTVRSFPLAKP
ncbi:ScyD/ScyE family protein [Paractinoplanes abujensis]|uniref:Sugar lactone lactonase YvrE n=1 Tax=Paractinoplanes abujensis TaxID=882441 RepID=A0A7W7FZW5_9ACTN|nr:ScyD/ScyE family protein [Actinoplanes abujensis]MBB4690490.1 sugar lactone lactonase YvrE [Actinoplanes abujensis]